MSVTVIIVNYNSGLLLENCIACLLRQSVPASHILVMDNASTDGSSDRIQHLSGVKVNYLGCNLGFSAANNRALDQCNTEFVALLNPDAYPEPQWLESLIHAAHKYPDFDAFGSRQLNATTPKVLDGVGDAYHISGKFWREGLGRCQQDGDFVAREIFAPCAAAALYRRQALMDVSGFDENFFCYVEDVDLGFRMRLSGHKAMYVPEAVVHHVGSAITGGSRSNFTIYHTHRNMVWCFVKNMPGFLFWLLLPLHLLLNISSVIWFAAAGYGGVILLAKWDALLGLPKMWKKRKQIQVKRLASVLDVWRVLSKGAVRIKGGR